MRSYAVSKVIDAVQWSDVDVLPETLPAFAQPAESQGFHFCLPEIVWSFDRKLIYFTYADLVPRHWIDVEPLTTEPQPSGLQGCVMITRYGKKFYRGTYPFNFWSVKSEQSVTRNHKPVFLDKSDQAMVDIFTDFMFVEKWTNPLPPRIEFRKITGAYARGYQTFYLKPTDWLVCENGEYRVVSDEAFKAMGAEEI